MAKKLTLQQVLRRMKKLQGKRSQREFADELRISQAFLSDVLLGRRMPGPTLLKRLGLEMKCHYYARR